MDIASQTQLTDLPIAEFNIDQIASLISQTFRRSIQQDLFIM